MMRNKNLPNQCIELLYDMLAFALLVSPVGDGRRCNWSASEFSGKKYQWKYGFDNWANAESWMHFNENIIENVNTWPKCNSIHWDLRNNIA